MSKQLPIDGSRDALWMATATAAPATTALQGHSSYDVTIIGGGITGLNAALHLTEHGLSVCVLESSGLGYGASGRSGGQVNLGLNLSPTQLIKKFGVEKGERLINLVINTPDNVFRLISHYQMDCDPIQNGWIQGAINRSHLRDHDRLAAEYAKYNCRLELLDQTEIANRTGSSRYLGGLYCAMAGSIQPLSYTRELARAAIARGADIFTDSAVTGIGPAAGDPNSWTISTTQGRVDSQQVLICTNGYTGKPLSQLIKKIVPIRSILIASEPLCADLRNTILPGQVTFVDKRRLILYFRYDRDGRLCVGDHGPMRDTFYDKDFIGLKRRLIEVFPQLSNIRWDYHWGGRIAMTRDSLPFLYQAAPGLTAGMGYNGRGVGMGTMMGKALADSVLATGNNHPDFPVSRPKSFSLHKFHSAGASMAIKWMALRDHLDSI